MLRQLQATGWAPLVMGFLWLIGAASASADPAANAAANADGLTAGHASANALFGDINGTRAAAVLPQYGTGATAPQQSYYGETALGAHATSELTACMANLTDPTCKAIVDSQTIPLTRPVMTISPTSTPIVNSDAVRNDPASVGVSLSGTFTACTPVTSVTPPIYTEEQCNASRGMDDVTCSKTLTVNLYTVNIITLGSTCYQDTRWCSPWNNWSDMVTTAGWINSGYGFIYVNGVFHRFVPAAVAGGPDPIGEYPCGRYRNNELVNVCTATWCDSSSYGGGGCYCTAWEPQYVSTTAGTIMGCDYGCVDGVALGRGGTYSFCNLASCPNPTIAYGDNVVAIGCTGTNSPGDTLAGIYCPDGYYQSGSNPVVCRESIGLTYDADPSYHLEGTRSVTSSVPGVTAQQQIYSKDTWDNQCAPYEARLP